MKGESNITVSIPDDLQEAVREEAHRTRRPVKAIYREWLTFGRDAAFAHRDEQDLGFRVETKPVKDGGR